MKEDRVKEGLGHLQGAALEVIAAVRAFLDVAEDLVRDPAELAAMAATLRPQPGPGEDDDGGSKVQRIPVN